jgi:uncharacterized protein (TIGR02266 family)
MLIDRAFAELLSDGPGNARFSAGAAAHGQARGRPLSDPPERRAAPRIPVETDVTIGGGGRVLTAVSGDVSLGGIFVSSFRLLPEGSRVSLRFRLPTGQVMAAGVVRWVREARPGRLGGMGVELLEVGEIDRDVLQRFCGVRPRLLSHDEIGSPS